MNFDNLLGSDPWLIKK